MLMIKNEIHIKNAASIANILLKRAKLDQDIILWDNKNINNKNYFVDEFDYSLSTGTTGIIYFYTELFDLTKNRKYLEIAEQSVNGLVINLNKKLYFKFGFMNGLTGVVFLFIKLYIVTSNKVYLLYAKRYCKVLSDAIFFDSLNNSLFDGRAGALLVFLNLYLITNDKDLLDLIYTIVRKILWEARFDKSGLNWYHSQTQTSGLVGFGYGSFGISYALTLLNNYILKDNQLKTLFDGGFEHCKNKWNPKINSWPDYNIMIKTEDDDNCLINRFSNLRERRIILKGKDSVNFSDGFIGVLFGLSFLESRMKLDSSLMDLITTAKSCFTKVENNLDEILDFSASNFIKLLFKENLENFANNKMIDYHGKELGLKNGLSGIGYLELIESGKVINPYYSFFLEGSNSENNRKKFGSLPDNLNFKNLILFPYLKHYPTTLNLINKEYEKSTIEKLYLQLNKVDFVHFRLLVRQLLNTNKKNEIIRTVFRYEVKRHQFYQKKNCCAELYVNNYLSFIANRSLQKNNLSEILNKTYRLSKNTKIVCLNYNISKFLNGIFPPENEIVEKGKTYILLQYTDTESYVTQETLSDLDEIIINFKNPLKAGYVLETLIKQNDLEDKKKLIRKRFSTVILKYVQRGTLIEKQFTNSKIQFSI
jgi:hypothetical protein